MRLGDYIFEFDPDRMTIPFRVKMASREETYDSAQLFEWQNILAGLEIKLIWDMCPVDQWTNLNNKFQAGGQYEFNPDEGSGVKSYTVEILDFYGEYESVILDDFDYRRNTELTLMIVAAASTTTTTTTSTTSTTSTTTTTTA